ncbi:hypothetical protein COTS27_00314 [Spirochaetota bacterium]|nr:hypothetical protein COTS27_00314 [Spirochaetota bacterium]
MQTKLLSRLSNKPINAHLTVLLLVLWLAGIFLINVLYSADKTETELVSRVIATGLEVPWQIDFAPERRIFITERHGRVLVFNSQAETASGTLPKPAVWTTLTNVFERGEGGLLGIAIDPDFATTPYVYLAYNESRNGKPYHQLVRYIEITTNINGQSRRVGKLDKVLISNIPGAVFHNGGRLKFAKDKTLFWGIGDRLIPDSAQNLNVLTGKILRLTREGGIPGNNPFRNSYIYSYGHRNVQGIAFSDKGDQIFASEHGPSSWNLCCRDEVNEIYAGANYGWPVITGDQTHPKMITPLLHSGTNITWAPGGLVYVSEGKWAHSLLVTGLRGRSLYRIVLAKQKRSNGKLSRSRATKLEVYFNDKWGRLRDIAKGNKRYGFSDNYYILTSNRDGRGNPRKDDDKIILFSLP